jgi:hypothetical protein
MSSLRPDSHFKMSSADISTSRVDRVDESDILMNELNTCLRIVQDSASPYFRMSKKAESHELPKTAAEVKDHHAMLSGNHVSRIPDRNLLPPSPSPLQDPVSDRIWMRTWLDQVDSTVFWREPIPRPAHHVFYERLLEEKRELERTLDKRIVEPEARNFPPLDRAMEQEVSGIRVLVNDEDDCLEGSSLSFPDLSTAEIPQRDYRRGLQHDDQLERPSDASASHLAK